MIRELIRSQPPRQWLADALGLGCVFLMTLGFLALLAEVLA